MTNKQRFAKSLYAIRTREGLTQEELAIACSLQTSHISHFECGRRSPSLDNLIRIANALSVSIDILTGRQALSPSSGSKLLERVEELEGAIREVLSHRKEDKDGNYVMWVGEGTFLRCEQAISQE